MLLIQGMNLVLNEDDIVMLYTYFDERNYGEISYETYIDKLDSFSLMLLSKKDINI